MPMINISVTGEKESDIVVIVVTAIVITMPVTGVMPAMIVIPITGITAVTGSDIPMVMVMPVIMAVIIPPMIAAIVPVITTTLITVAGVIPSTVIPGMLLADAGDPGAGF